jgi:hypothetical protein
MHIYKSVIITYILVVNFPYAKMVLGAKHGGHLRLCRALFVQV